MAIITADDLLSHLSLTTARNDDAVARAVAAANSAVVRWCGRSFERVDEDDETARVFRADSWHNVYTDDFWSTTNLVVKTDDTNIGSLDTTWPITDYILEPLNGRENGKVVPYHQIVSLGGRAFPLSRQGRLIEVTAAWGWASVPDDVKTAALIKATRLYLRKDSPHGTAGFNDFGVMQMTSVDIDVKDLLEPFLYPRQMVA